MKRNCNNCGAEYEADNRNLKRGWGLTCSKSCAAQQREANKISEPKKKFEVCFKGFIEIEAADIYEANKILDNHFLNASNIKSESFTEFTEKDGITNVIDTSYVIGHCEATGRPIFEGDNYDTDEDGIMILND